MPAGSFRNTCRGCKVLTEQETLSCSHCLKPCGAQTRSSISMRGCESFGNSEGRLSCEVHRGPGLPRGSYERSCSGCTVSEGLLRCQCQGPRERQDTWTEVSRCEAFGNNGGELVCDGERKQEPEAQVAGEEDQSQGDGQPQQRLQQEGQGQQQKQQQQQEQMQNLPEGNYRRSCVECSVANGWLTCQCKQPDASRVQSRVRLSSYCNTYSNDNGMLSCHESLPAGTYKHSCSGCKAVDNQLSCSCSAPTGKVKASTKIGTCRSFGNEGGKLVCDDLKNAENIPQGTYRGSCKGCSMFDGALTCTHCSTPEKTFETSSLDTRTCQGKGTVISNENGILTCLGSDEL